MLYVEMLSQVDGVKIRDTSDGDTAWVPFADMEKTIAGLKAMGISIMGVRDGKPYLVDRIELLEAWRVKAKLAGIAQWYAISPDGGTLTKYLGTGGVVSMPPVMYIGTSSFWNGKAPISKIVIPHTVVAISDFAFASENSARRRIDNIKFMRDLYGIGHAAFHNVDFGCDIVIPGGPNIAKMAFWECTAKSLSLGGGSEIEGQAFQGCAISRVSLVDGVAMVGSKCFCQAKIDTLAVDTRCLRDSRSAFVDASIRHIHVTVRGSDDNIPYETFYGCKDVETLIIDEGIKSIGAYALADLSSVKNIHLPSTVQLLDAQSVGIYNGVKSDYTIEVPAHVFNGPAPDYLDGRRVIAY